MYELVVERVVWLTCLHPWLAGTNYVETLRVQVHASCRLRRIFFCDRQYREEELPVEFRLCVPGPVR